MIVWRLHQQINNYWRKFNSKMGETAGTSQLINVTSCQSSGESNNGIYLRRSTLVLSAKHASNILRSSVRNTTEAKVIVLDVCLYA